MSPPENLTNLTKTIEGISTINTTSISLDQNIPLTTDTTLSSKDSKITNMIGTDWLVESVTLVSDEELDLMMQHFNGKKIFCTEVQ